MYFFMSYVMQQKKICSYLKKSYDFGNFKKKQPLVEQHLKDIDHLIPLKSHIKYVI